MVSNPASKPKPAFIFDLGIGTAGDSTTWKRVSLGSYLLSDYSSCHNPQSSAAWLQWNRCQRESCDKNESLNVDIHHLCQPNQCCPFHVCFACKHACVQQILRHKVSTDSTVCHTSRILNCPCLLSSLLHAVPMWQQHFDTRKLPLLQISFHSQQLILHRQAGFGRYRNAN